MIGENLKYLRKQRHWTQQELAEKLGLPRTTLGDYERGKTEPNISMLIQLAEIFQIPVDDLLTTTLVADRKKGLHTDDTTLLSMTQFGVVELVESKAEAGYLENMADPEYVKELPKLYFPNLPKNQYRGFEINGDSMLPIGSGSLIITTYVDDLSQVKNHKTYVIITKREGLVYKRLQWMEGGDAFLAISDNPIYPPYPIPFEDIAEIWGYYAHVSFSDQSINFLEQVKADRWRNMEVMIEELHEKLIKE